MGERKMTGGLKSSALSLGFGFLGLYILLGYNACSEVSFTGASEEKATALDETLLQLSGGGVLINDGEAFTRLQVVRLTLSAQNAQQMKISQGLSCEGGAWESFKTTKLWDLEEENTEAHVSVQFRSDLGEPTRCFSDGIVHDDVAPRVDYLTDSFISSQSIATVEFNATDEGSGVESMTCSLQGSEVQEQECANRVDWSNLSEGRYRMSVRARDRAGNEVLADGLPFVIDQSGPVLTLNQVAQLTASTQSRIEFSAIDAYSEVVAYECRLGSSDPDSTWVSCASPWIVSHLEEGVIHISVRAKDQVGNFSNTESRSFEVDFSGPELQFTEMPPPLSNRSTSQFAFEARFRNEVISSFECSVDQAPYSRCQSPLVVGPLSAGVHSFKVKATNSLGVSSEIEHRWQIDTEQPIVRLVEYPAPLTNQPVARFAWIAEDSGGIDESSLNCLIDGQPVECQRDGFISQPLQDGMHQFVVSIKDRAGNLGQAQYQWVVDTEKPSLQMSFRSPQDFFINNNEEKFTLSNQVAIELLATDSSEISAIECEFEAGAGFVACGEITQLGDQFLSVFERGDLHPHRSFALRAKSRDLAGNESEIQVLEWAVDQKAPSIEFDELTHEIEVGQQARIQFRVFDPAPGAGVKQVVCGVEAASGTLDSCEKSDEEGVSSSYSIVLEALPIGTHSFLVTAMDHLGNEGSESVLIKVLDGQPAPPPGPPNPPVEPPPFVENFDCREYIALSVGSGQLEVPERKGDGVCYFVKLVSKVSGRRSGSPGYDTRDPLVIAADHSKGRSEQGYVHENNPFILGLASFRLLYGDQWKVAISGAFDDPSADMFIDNFFLLEMKSELLDKAFAFGTGDARAWIDGQRREVRRKNSGGDWEPVADFRVFAKGGTAVVKAISLDEQTRSLSGEWQDFRFRALDCGGSAQLSNVFLVFH